MSRFLSSITQFNTNYPFTVTSAPEHIPPNTLLYRFSLHDTVLISGKTKPVKRDPTVKGSHWVDDNVSFWQTKPNLRYGSKYLYITNLSKLKRYTTVRWDQNEMDQGNGLGISIVAFHTTPIPEGVIRRIENIVVGRTEGGNPVVNTSLARSAIKGVIIEPLGDSTWVEKIKPEDWKYGYAGIWHRFEERNRSQLGVVTGIK